MHSYDVYTVLYYTPAR